MEIKQKISSFTDLIAWQESYKLVLMIYRATKLFPQNEQFGLISQMRRAAVSITSNLAEGFSRESARDKTRFYFIAKASLTELQNELLISRDVDYIKLSKFSEISEQSIKARQLIIGLIRSTKKLF